MNLVPSVSDRLCCCKTRSNRNIGKRLEGGKRHAPSGFVLALLLAVIINNPVAAQVKQTTPVTINQRVREAVERNLSLLAKRYDLSVAEIEYSYRAGEASLVEFLDAQRAFNDTMQGYNEARAEYARSL
jgi:outer membrane protein TolC